MSVVGFVVAGGRSSRMGRDKALLPWEGTDLLGHALARLAAVTVDVRILCGPEPRYLDRGVPAIIDVVPDAGPLGGVLTGLEAAAPRGGLFLAVDLPLVPVPLVRRLVEESTGWDAVVPHSPRGREPLCAFYGPACLEPIRRCVALADFRMTAFWPGLRVREITPREILPFGDPGTLFFNLNSRGDLPAAGG